MVGCGTENSMDFGIYSANASTTIELDQLLHFKKVVALNGQPIDITYDKFTNTILFTEKKQNSATRIGQYSLDDLAESTVIGESSKRK